MNTAYLSTKTMENKISLKESYLEFCDSQLPYRTLWYIIPLMTLSAGVMPVSILLMSYVYGFLPFVIGSMLIFFANIIVNIAKAHTRVTITLYFVTIFLNFFIPFASFLLFGLKA